MSNLLTFYNTKKNKEPKKICKICTFLKIKTILLKTYIYPIESRAKMRLECKYNFTSPSQPEKKKIL